jgi:predicted extracellular nuclease
MSSSIENTINIAFVFQLQLYHQGLNVKTKVTINNYIVEYITTNLNIKYKEDVYV